MARAVPALLAQSPAGDAFGRDAEFVALWVLHHGPAMGSSRQLMFADDRGAVPHELVDG